MIMSNSLVITVMASIMLDFLHTHTHMYIYTLYIYIKCDDMPIPTSSGHNTPAHRGIADVCFELHFRVTPGQFRSAAVG